MASIVQQTWESKTEAAENTSSRYTGALPSILRWSKTSCSIPTLSVCGSLRSFKLLQAVLLVLICFIKIGKKWRRGGKKKGKVSFTTSRQQLKYLHSWNRIHYKFISVIKRQLNTLQVLQVELWPLTEIMLSTIYNSDRYEELCQL